MSELFGLEFDKHIYKSLMEDIDFKDQRSLLNNRNNSTKVQFLIQEFPSLLSRPDFINIFSYIVEFMNTTASATEIFDGLVKLLKLSYENQFKILISFFYSMNQNNKDDVKNIFFNKCNEIMKDSKSDQLSKQTIQMIILIINSYEEFKYDNFLKNTFINFLLNKQMKSMEAKDHEEFIHVRDLFNIIFRKLMLLLIPLKNQLSSRKF